MLIVRGLITVILVQYSVSKYTVLNQTEWDLFFGESDGTAMLHSSGGVVN